MDKLNILYVGNTHVPHASENSVVRELIRRGHNVVNFPYPTVAGTNFPLFNENMFKVINNGKFDLFIGSKCMGLKSYDIKQIKIPKVSWVFDLFQGYITWKRREWYARQAPHWDCCFGAEGGQVDLYKDKGINYHPLKCGADPTWHKKIPYHKDHEIMRCDVSFLGGLYNQLRINMASRINCMNINFKNFVGYQVRSTMLPGVYMEQISELATVGKISIGCNYRNDIPGYWSKRPYELMGGNNFMIQAHVDGMEDDGFKDKKNTVFFHKDNFDEMAKLIEYYLENEEERNKIKEAGYKLIHEKHMMEHRVDSFFATLKKENII